MPFTQPAVLIGSVFAGAILFALTAYFTRAPWRRAAAALIASIPVVPIVMIYDSIAARFGWWQYPSLAGAPAPVAWYIAAALWYGAGFGLIIWWATARFGKAGLAAFIFGEALIGLGRDLFYAKVSGLILFGPGILPLAVDFFAYASVAALVQWLMALVLKYQNPI
jgi:hypothetical protein